PAKLRDPGKDAPEVVLGKNLRHLRNLPKEVLPQGDLCEAIHRQRAIDGNKVIRAGDGVRRDIQKCLPGKECKVANAPKLLLRTVELLAVRDHLPCMWRK